MKIYGHGAFDYPGTSRVVWDFEDGPFDTVNPILIEEAKRRGYSFVAPPPPHKFVRRGPGRPPKVVVNADEKPSAKSKALGNGPKASKENGDGNAEGKEAPKEKEGK
jgi:hypothetical protein